MIIHQITKYALIQDNRFDKLFVQLLNVHIDAHTEIKIVKDPLPADSLKIKKD
ncbi:MAG: hypothetical protein ACFFBP_22335 [Promethearchaeota archaeon]